MNNVDRLILNKLIHIIHSKTSEIIAEVWFSIMHPLLCPRKTSCLFIFIYQLVVCLQWFWLIKLNYISYTRFLFYFNQLVVLLYKLVFFIFLYPIVDLWKWPTKNQIPFHTHIITLLACCLKCLWFFLNYTCSKIASGARLVFPKPSLRLQPTAKFLRKYTSCFV